MGMDIHSAGGSRMVDGGEGGSRGDIVSAFLSAPTHISYATNLSSLSHSLDPTARIC